MKKLWVLMVVHTGEVRTNYENGTVVPLNFITPENIFSFPTKKQAWKWINDKNAWALIPAKVVKDMNRWNQNDTYYHFTI